MVWCIVKVNDIYINIISIQLLHYIILNNTAEGKTNSNFRLIILTVIIRGIRNTCVNGVNCSGQPVVRL